jgi:hypothetical protein
MAKNKRPGDRVAGIAGRVLQAGKATPSQAKALAGYALGDDPKKGPNKPKAGKKR